MQNILTGMLILLNYVLPSTFVITKRMKKSTDLPENTVLKMESSYFSHYSSCEAAVMISKKIGHLVKDNPSHRHYVVM